MKKKSLLLLIVPAAGLLLAGCNAKDTLRTVRDKIKTGTDKVVQTLDDFFADEEEEEANKTASYALK